jgi:hypothetical protein
MAQTVCKHAPRSKCLSQLVEATKAVQLHGWLLPRRAVEIHYGKVIDIFITVFGSFLMHVSMMSISGCSLPALCH